MNKKSIAMYSTLALLIVGGIYLVKPVSADEETRFGPRIQRLIERFNLNEDEVQEVMYEFRQENHENRLADLETKLQAAVAAGKITSDQKDTILAKMTELHESMPDWDSISEDERREIMESHRAEMQAWAEENGVDFRDLELGHRGGMGKRDGMGMGQGMGKHSGFNK